MSTSPNPVDLLDVFTVQADGRLHCNFCTYDTQMEGSARRHTITRHNTNLKPLAIIVKQRGVVPAEMPTEIVPVLVPEPVSTPEGD